MNGTQPSRLTFIAVAFAFLVVMLGTTLPTPLYPIYQRLYGFSEVIITVIYASYTIGVIGALIIMGSWSDQVGRRPMLALGLACSAISAVIFLVAGGLGWFLVARFVCGLSAGIFTGTATVAVIEQAPSVWRGVATFVATAANMVGLSLGPLLAGVLAQYTPWPVHLVFAVDLVLLAIAALGVWYAPETAERPERPRLRMQRLSLPRPVRGVFIPAAIAGFTGFAVFGLFSAIAPAFMSQVLNYSNHALTGAVVFVVFAASAAGQLLHGRVPVAARLPGGCVALAIGVVLVGVGVGLASLVWLLVGTVVAGLGQGLSFRAGIGEVTAASPAERSGEVASTFFVVLYVALSIPIIGIGFAAAQLGLSTAATLFTACVAALALLALGALLWRQRWSAGR